MDKLKKDIILPSGIVLTSFLFWLIPSILNKAVPATVGVYQDGQEIGRYSLMEDQTVSIPYGDGGYNLLFISSGHVSVSDADCPDGLCVRQKAITGNGESIICLPHKLVIQIEAQKEGELDAVTY